MLEITKTELLYTFDELSETAKENAISLYRSEQDLNYMLDEEYESIKNIADAIGCTFELNSYCDYEINLDFYYGNKPDSEMELAGRRAVAFIWNNYINPNLKGKYYSTGGKYINGKYTYKNRYSNCIKEFNCPFTGLYMDNDLYITFQKFCDEMKSNNNLKVSDFIEMLADQLSSDWNAQVDWLLSEDHIKEEIEVNEMYFYSDGTAA